MFRLVALLPDNIFFDQVKQNLILWKLFDKKYPLVFIQNVDVNRIKIDINCKTNVQT